MDSGKRVVVSDIAKSRLFEGTASRGVLLDSGVYAVQSTPLISRSGELVGVVSTHWKKLHSLNHMEEHLLDLLVRQAADLIESSTTRELLRTRERELQAIEEPFGPLTHEICGRCHLPGVTEKLMNRAEQLRALVVEISTIDEREHRRLAEILHDDIQQLLVNVKIQIDMVSQRIAAGGEASGVLGNVGQLLEEVVEKSRYLSQELNPPSLQFSGVGPSLEWLADRFRLECGLTVDISGDGTIEPSSRLAKSVIFKAVQELLWNVAKHAKVDSATIDIRRKENAIEIAVADRGAGFEPSRLEVAQDPQALGLL